MMMCLDSSNKLWKIFLLNENDLCMRCLRKVLGTLVTSNFVEESINRVECMGSLVKTLVNWLFIRNDLLKFWRMNISHHLYPFITSTIFRD